MRDEQAFLAEIEERLAENRKVVESSPIPTPLKPLASYLGLHTVRMLGLGSLLITMGLYMFFREEMRLINQILFGL